MKKIIIFGAGRYGKKFLGSLISNYDVQIAAYTDNDEKEWGGGKSICSIPVLPPAEIVDIEFDLVLIMIADPMAISQVKDQLKAMGIPEKKISDIETDLEYMDLYMDQRIHWIRDYAAWIYKKGISGNVAECGVFRGDSAKFLNKYFPDKTLYLFDTFEGFAAADIDMEKKINETFDQSEFANPIMFKQTNMDYLMRKMMYPQNVVIKKGYFPETAVGLEDKFCFASLDMDLYVPMLAGLRYFWDRMEEGGCILLHDYFHGYLPGVQKAVEQFEKDRKIEIMKSPIGDACSIALFK